jgi:hypothetical protein
VGAGVPLRFHQPDFAMPNFSQRFPVEGALLDFCFSLIYQPGGARYWVAVSREEQYVTSFYFEQDYRGEWKLSDRYRTAPGWVHDLEPLLAEAIGDHIKLQCTEEGLCSSKDVLL